jgi:ribosomal protein L29|tara:strand:+ start:286 stop:471 length:186 start_codon:yes stop_codon:yes gene_type:complete
MLRKEVEKMTIQEMRDEIQKLEQELENLKTKEKLMTDLKLKVMGQICAYEYLILQEKQRVA